MAWYEAMVERAVPAGEGGGWRGKRRPETHFIDSRIMCVGGEVFTGQVISEGGAEIGVTFYHGHRPRK